MTMSTETPTADVLEPEPDSIETAFEPDVSAAEACPNCGSTEPWGGASWCPECGFYPKLNKCVGGGCAEAKIDQEPAKLIDLFPPWTWVLGGGMAAIIVFSIIVRTSLGAEHPQRGLIALSQFIVGLIVLLVAQGAAFMKAVSMGSEFGPPDIFMKPFEIWKYSVQDLPKSAKKFWLMGWSLTIAISALTIIGGIRYSAIFDDWGYQKSAQANLLQSISKMAQENAEEGDEGNLEDSIDNFANGESPEDEDDLKQYEPVDCLIVGYTKSANSGISTLLLAKTVKNELKFVGSLPARQLPKEAQASLLRRMQNLRQAKPFVKMSLGGIWLKPVLMCKVSSKNFEKNKKLKGVKFESLLRDTRFE